MGYDMYIWFNETKEEAEQREVECQRLRDEASRLYAARDKLPEDQGPQRDSVTWEFQRGTGSEEWWALQDAAEKLGDQVEVLRGYFRLNIWGMSKCREVMNAFGMIDYEAESTEEYPKAKDYFPDAADDDDFESPGVEREYEAGSPEAKYVAAARAHLGAVSESGLIPVYKLGSNDGWIVTPQEIEGSLAKLSNRMEEVKTPEGVLYKFTDPELPEWFGEWISFLKRASKESGFRVH